MDDLVIETVSGNVMVHAGLTQTNGFPALTGIYCRFFDTQFFHAECQRRGVNIENLRCSSGSVDLPP